MLSVFSNDKRVGGFLGRNQAMDVLRILACMGVILAHSAVMCFTIHVMEKGSAEWIMCYIIKKVALWSVPAFTMLTGFFFLNPEKKLPLNKLYGKNTLRLALALVFWTLFNAVTVHSRYYPYGGVETNYWYVGMCIGLYISMPVLRRIAANDKLLKYSCWIWFFIRCYYCIGKYVDVPIVFTDYVFAEFVGYCLWGYYLSRIKLNRKKTIMAYFVGIVCLLAVALVPLLTNSKVVFEYADPITAIAVFAIFLYFIKHPLNYCDRTERFLAHFSKATFGIYLAHTFVVIETFSRLYRFFPNPYVLVPVAFCVILGLSYVITIIIKQIPFLRDWVV
jgi:surface polysaccharide O-acyltransferase-like enzyme